MLRKLSMTGVVKRADIPRQMDAKCGMTGWQLSAKALKNKTRLRNAVALRNRVSDSVWDRSDYFCSLSAQL
jgi:hypothetical protein